PPPCPAPTHAVPFALTQEPPSVRLLTLSVRRRPRSGHHAPAQQIPARFVPADNVPGEKRKTWKVAQSERRAAGKTKRGGAEATATVPAGAFSGRCSLWSRPVS